MQTLEYNFVEHKGVILHKVTGKIAKKKDGGGTQNGDLTEIK